ncbi:hypothetical protein EW093_11275 [Thiospirochaeta perfilievii]|uniref:Uncharacterized protein n=1 Tax=Thiospirochaeta perfilievii TaxID=252967 RepID=A0A5C1QE60_9SPIO|nr:hypothetical protein [Thiospirochaeta perfilievii]QEN05269.1 hypothetical protein EW093_11275 [Thiospirochaeta perfilievii]
MSLKGYKVKIFIYKKSWNKSYKGDVLLYLIGSAILYITSIFIYDYMPLRLMVSYTVIFNLLYLDKLIGDFKGDRKHFEILEDIHD